ACVFDRYDLVTRAVEDPRGHRHQAGRGPRVAAARLWHHRRERLRVALDRVEAPVAAHGNTRDVHSIRIDVLALADALQELDGALRRPTSPDAPMGALRREEAVRVACLNGVRGKKAPWMPAPAEMDLDVAAVVVAPLPRPVQV